MHREPSCNLPGSSRTKSLEAMSSIGGRMPVTGSTLINPSGLDNWGKP